MPRNRVEVGLEERDFRDKDVIALLDELPLQAVIAALGPHDVQRNYARPFGYWKQGDGRPALADDDPAVQQALARCAASRARGPVISVIAYNAHPQECGWCGYPTDELLKVCDWVTFHAKYVVSEVLVWIGKLSSRYQRAGEAGWYENPKYAVFWTMPSEERAALILAAQYPSEAAA